jgi:hypothetical protein
MNIDHLSAMNDAQKRDQLEQEIRRIAQTASRPPATANNRRRVKRQFAALLSPAIFSPLINSANVFGFVILSPSVFSPQITSPFVLAPNILSANIGEPTILSTRVCCRAYIVCALLRPYV